MHFWIILYFLDPWQTGLDFAEKEKQHFVPWLEKFWNKKSQEIEKKSRQNRSQRTPGFNALLQNLRDQAPRPKTRQFFCLLEIFGCWDGTGFAGSKWSAWFNLHCTGGLTETPPSSSSSNIQYPSALFFGPGRFCFGICFTIFTIGSG